jgi:hypothetical protein
MVNGDCQSCHNERSWASIKFDHSKTKFVLVGKHQTTTCRKCHWNSKGEWSVKQLQFKLHKQNCQDCHKDIHQDQFVTAGVTRCEQCHSPKGWKALTFDHNTQSRFKLLGAHAKVPCAGCHKPETVDMVEFVRYKPLGVLCVDCHDSNISLDSL